MRGIGGFGSSGVGKIIEKENINLNRNSNSNTPSKNSNLMKFN